MGRNGQRLLYSENEFKGGLCGSSDCGDRFDGVLGDGRAVLCGRIEKNRHHTSGHATVRSQTSFSMGVLEASTGIEPVYTDLQSGDMH